MSGREVVLNPSLAVAPSGSVAFSPVASNSSNEEPNQHRLVEGHRDQLGGNFPPGSDLEQQNSSSFVCAVPQVQPRECGVDLEASEAEHHIRGYFIVEEVLKHKYRQGYQFLTKWQNFSVSEATWEPTLNFVQPDGFINEIFATYCKAEGLTTAWKQALNLSNRRQAAEQG